MSTNPASELTRILNTLDLELNAIADPAERAEMAHEVSERGRMIQNIAGPVMRRAVQEMRDGGASHATVAERLGVSRARAQQLVGIPVVLTGGPHNGETVAAAPQRNGRPNRQIVMAVPNGRAVNYWRRLEPEADGGWVAEFYEGTRAPLGFTKDLTTTR